jgi:hypothetical protein
LARNARKAVGGAAAIIAVLAVIAAVGVHSAKPAVKSARASHPARLAAAPATVAARVNPVPFTRVDFVLLLTGGAIVLVIGSSVRRIRVEREDNR